jgi:DNA-binding response OmpR family regulator
MLYNNGVMGQKILIIEDNAAFRKAVSRILSESDYAVVEASTGKAGLRGVLQEQPDLVILDLVLPGVNGMEVCQELKRQVETAAIPILILTGNDREGQDIACLDVGADDYLTKPVEMERLLAHCRALLRRLGPDAVLPNTLVSVGSLDLDFARKRVLLKGKEYSHLTPKEFGLLYELALHSPQPVNREALYQKVWGMEPPSEGSLKTVDVHARRIRLKMDWSPDEWLSYVNGRGYCLVVPPAK